MKKQASRTPSKKAKAKPSDEQIAAWREEYEWMVKLAEKAENETGQTDTYWHTSMARLEAALKALDLEV